MSTRWQGADAPRGEMYDRRWRQLAEAGQSIHGEADLIELLLRDLGGSRVLDAGCGTGRVAVELAARGYSVVGVDADPRMLDTARAKAPDLPWVQADLAALDHAEEPLGNPGENFDLIALAGNVMIFVQPGSEGRVLGQLAARLRAGGLLVAGFSVSADRLPLAEYDRLAGAAGLEPVSRWATWERAPYTGGDYAVSVHRRGTR